MINSDKIRLKIYLSVFATLLVFGTAGFMLLEGISLVDAFYFTIVTMATVGYGDIHPQSGLGKILALIIIVGGVGTFLGVVASITDLFANRREELLHREDFMTLPETDLKHLGGDINRVYSLLSLEWLRYIRYLKDNYGYLYSLAVRLNPFDSDASAVVEKP